LLVKASFPKYTWRTGGPSLGTCSSHPLPIYFPVLEVLRNAELSCVIIWFNPMGYDKFAGEASTTFFIKPCNGRRDGVDSEFSNALVNRKRKFTVHNRRPKRLIVVELVFAKAGVKTPNNIVVVLVDDENSSAEDDKVEVEHCHRWVEVGFLKNQIEDALAL